MGGHVDQLVGDRHGHVAQTVEAMVVAIVIFGVLVDGRGAMM